MNSIPDNGPQQATPYQIWEVLSLVLSPERAGECLDYAIAEKSKTDLERDFIAELRGLAAWLETESYYLEPSLKYPSQAAAQLIQATVPKN